MKIEEWLNGNQLSLDIWHKKYQNENEDFEKFLDRVSGGYDKVRELILQKKFIFGGRILASRGVKDRKVTYSNCYVIAPPEDNIESIFDCCSKLARTYSYGGGCGIDLSNLRPNGAKVSNASKTSSGPVSFMDMFSQITQTISQNGRRGALMVSIDINHPDVEEFIDCKTDLNRVNYANISVRVNDSFMKAVEKNEDYLLRYPCNSLPVLSKENFENLEYNVLIPFGFGYVKKIRARELFNKLVKNNWDYAEPGILYWDQIQGYNLLDNTDFKYAGVNPCAEEPLPSFGSCLLGSLNLSEFVKFPFSDRAYVDIEGLEEAVCIAVNALNQVLMEGLKLHPLKEQQQTVGDYRQIGLGTMGLGDMLIKLGLTYGSIKSLECITTVYEAIAKAAVIQSLELAKIDSCYPKCEKEKLVDSKFIKNLHLSEATLDEIKKYGLYNSQLLTCAPTGSIGTMFEISTGVEPEFALSYTRKTVSLDNKDVYYQVDAKIVRDYKNITGNSKLTDCFVTSGTIKPIDRIKVQSVLQKYIDASISSTINLPKEATIDDVYNIYMSAWTYNLKGVTVYRSGCKREGILTTEPTKTTNEFDKIVPVSREDFGQSLTGKTYKYNTACGTLYITINKDSKGNIIEIFTNSSKNGTCKANLNGETRLASLALRSGVKVEEVIDSLKSIQCQSCAFARAKGNKIDGSSCPDIIAKCIKSEYNGENQSNKSIIGDKCPECGANLTHSGGCKQCESCGWSKCE